MSRATQGHLARLEALRHGKRTMKRPLAVLSLPLLLPESKVQMMAILKKFRELEEVYQKDRSIDMMSGVEVGPARHAKE